MASNNKVVKVVLTMPIFNDDCFLSAFVHSPKLTVSHENEEIRIIDENGVAHKAVINSCPDKFNSIDIKEFMKIRHKIKKVEEVNASAGTSSD